MKCHAKGCRRKGNRFVEIEWYKNQGVGNIIMSLCDRHSLDAILDPELQPTRRNKIRRVVTHEFR